ncbi:MAG: PHB depolymerase family esterase [bacterium]|nr:PHB depolymerase family esterase [bacterium]
MPLQHAVSKARALSLTLLLALSLALSAVLFTPGTVNAQNGSAGCSAGGVRYETGQPLERAIRHDGTTRDYLVYIPTTYNPAQPTALIFSLHGFASNPEAQMESSTWNDVAETGGFVVVYPQGTGFPLRWHPYPDDFYAAAGMAIADDVGFIAALIESLSSEYCIDPSRVFVTGYSNGGGMAHRIACELADQVAAIGTVAGAYPPVDSACSPSRPVPVMAFHGTADPIVPIFGDELNMGGLEITLPPVDDWVKSWAARNGCGSTPETFPPVGSVNGVLYSGCAGGGDVVYFTITDGGHTWPGKANFPELILGRVTRDINASAQMWDFFQSHGLG